MRIGIAGTAIATTAVEFNMMGNVREGKGRMELELPQGNSSRELIIIGRMRFRHMSKDFTKSKGAANEKGSSFTECLQIAQGILVLGTSTVGLRLQELNRSKE
jgi:hypothetical protein